ncbi:MAG: 1,4-beta-xylanase [Planctomycetaceae bacterium]
MSFLPTSLRRVALAGVIHILLAAPAFARERWTPEQADGWLQKHSWLVGCNFIPSSAINQLEMWNADSFDSETIDRELGWAHGLGYNSLRVFLHHQLWQDDREGFLKRMEQFLDIAAKHKIGVMFVLLDGVWDPLPKAGKQPAPRPHVHNSGWVQSPGAELLGDPKRHAELKPYVQGVIRHFRNDPRVQAWDLFNEPENPNTNSYGERGNRTELRNKAKMATLLLRELFVWARAAEPTQPLTVGVWLGPWPDHAQMSEIEKLMVEQSDVISFHNYGDLGQLKPRIEQLRRYERPILCTEYMARPAGSRFDPLLGFLKEQKVGAYNWGFVAGKAQTQYPWDSWQKKYTAEPELWFHEIFHPDGKGYDLREVEYIRQVTGAKSE